MTIGVLLICHQPLGQAMLDISIETIGVCPLATEVLDVPLDEDPDLLAAHAQEMIARLDSGDGVLVLSDLCGATPSNIASRLSRDGRVMVVCGLNLAMLMRVLNYPNLRLEHLAERAADGGRRGVILMSGGNEG